MKNTAAAHTGRHFLQIPGPTNVPDRVLQAIAMPTIDHRGPEFAELGKDIVAGMKRVFQTEDTVVVYPSSGTGAWEAALSNTMSPGDRVIMFETGHFASLWRQMAARLGLEVEFVPGDWRHGADPALVEEKLTADREHRLKAVCVVHNETSTGVASRIAEIREAIDRARHPALFMVDTISSLASIDYRHDEWKVDVTVAGSQKGLMLPPGLGFNAVSKKALGRVEDGAAAALLLGLGGDARNRAQRLFPLYAGHQPAVRAARGACRCCSTRRASERCSTATPATPRRRGALSPPGGSRSFAPIRANIRAR